MTKKKKVVFNEAVDNSINGLALVIAFIIVGVILQFDSSFFGKGTNMIKLSFIAIGILGLFTEISTLNNKFNIKGLDNISVGFILIIISYLLKVYINVNNWYDICNILFQTGLFFLILISIFGFSKGLLEMFYSLYKNYQDKNLNNKKSNLFSSIIVVLSQLFGLILILAQIYDIFK